MLDQGFTRRTKGNLALWIAVALLSVVGLGANVYKSNTGEELQWASVIGEVAIFLAAGYFIYDNLCNKHKAREEKEE
ncbi:MAG: hypothetical protein J6C60_02495 [Alistipes sp.]|nr:hypothetical protein [Alistipes sp.]MBO5399477.1 hypothetical protein [Alistipes sp.]